METHTVTVRKHKISVLGCRNVLSSVLTPFHTANVLQKPKLKKSTFSGTHLINEVSWFVLYFIDLELTNTLSSSALSRLRLFLYVLFMVNQLSLLTDHLLPETALLWTSLHVSCCSFGLLNISDHTHNSELPELPQST